MQIDLWNNLYPLQTLIQGSTARFKEAIQLAFPTLVS